MTSLLIRMLKNRHPEGAIHAKAPVLSGFVGIVCNLLLSALKLTVGLLSGALSVTADALNNLSDCAANVVTITGARLSEKPDDEEHPFGHGRLEYVSALVVVFFIFLMGFELGKSAVMKIITPEEVRLATWYIPVLVAAIAVKLWMTVFNLKLFKLSGNLNLKAVSQDSFNDSIATAATLAALLISHYLGVPRIDGIIGLCVAGFILVSGYQILKAVIGPLLGQAPSKEVTDKTEALMLENKLISGVHDLIVHSYGTARQIASAHAEVPADADLVTVHDAIDQTERRILEELGIEICIHMDPVARETKQAKKLRVFTEEILAGIDERLTFHDFRVAQQGEKTLLQFDVVAPFETDRDEVEIKRLILTRFREEHPEIEPEISVEHLYVK